MAGRARLSERTPPVREARRSPGSARAASARGGPGGRSDRLRGDGPQSGGGDDQRHGEHGDGQRGETVATSAARPQPWATPVATSRPVTSTAHTSSACPPRRAAPPRASSPSRGDQQEQGDADQQHPRRRRRRRRAATTRAAAPPATAARPEAAGAAGHGRAHRARPGAAQEHSRRGRRGTGPAPRAAGARRRPSQSDRGDGDGDHADAQGEPLGPRPPGHLGGRQVRGAVRQDAGSLRSPRPQCPSPPARFRQARHRRACATLNRWSSHHRRSRS